MDGEIFFLEINPLCGGMLMIIVIYTYIYIYVYISVFSLGRDPQNVAPKISGIIFIQLFFNGNLNL